MGKRSKNFEKWKDAKSPVSADKVKAIIDEVFAGRVKPGEGSSHLHKVQVPELKDLPDYQFGLITIPLKGGQQVKAPYLQLLYEAAILLELYLPKEADEDQEEREDGEEDDE